MPALSHDIDLEYDTHKYSSYKQEWKRIIGIVDEHKNI